MEPVSLEKGLILVRSFLFQIWPPWRFACQLSARGQLPGHIHSAHCGRLALQGWVGQEWEIVKGCIAKPHPLIQLLLIIKLIF